MTKKTIFSQNNNIICRGTLTRPPEYILVEYTHVKTIHLGCHSCLQ